MTQAPGHYEETKEGSCKLVVPKKKEKMKVMLNHIFKKLGKNFRLLQQRNIYVFSKVDCTNSEFSHICLLMSFFLLKGTLKKSRDFALFFHCNGCLEKYVAQTRH